MRAFLVSSSWTLCWNTRAEFTEIFEIEKAFGELIEKILIKG
jgi:hypothetical protein